MSGFSLLQIDVEVEEPETSENPTQSYEIHNIDWRLKQLLAVIIYYMIEMSMYNMILFRYRALGLPPDRSRSSKESGIRASLAGSFFLDTKM